MLRHSYNVSGELNVRLVINLNDNPRTNLATFQL